VKEVSFVFPRNIVFEKKMAELNREEIRERLGNIDQIRDIIFGPQLREYNSRLDKIESNLSLMEQEMRERIEQVKNACLTEVRASVESLEQKIKTSNLNYQNENAELRQLIDRVNKKFSSSIEALDQTIDTQTTSIWNNLSETKEKLQEDNRNLRLQIFEELERRFTTLSGAKVSRDDMAEILFELGLRIKGTEFAPELKDAAGTDVSPDIRLLEATRVSE
jgi:DNA anti-recombination protein RmuC